MNRHLLLRISAFALAWATAAPVLAQDGGSGTVTEVVITAESRT